MRILFVTPVKRDSTRGNGVTARRWAQFSETLGHETEILESYTAEPCDVLVALHARRSHESILRYCSEPDRGRLVVALTGTDVYGDLPDSIEAQESLRLADRIVVLQDHARGVVPAPLREKVHTVLQSAEMPSVSPADSGGAFVVALVGHLRDVKDPLRAAEAVRSLPEASRIEVLQVGLALDEGLAERAQREQASNPHYRWLGGVSEAEAKRLLAGADLALLTSKMEGGANVISEAIVAGVPVVSSRIGGSIGMLGDTYPGYFDVGDTEGLREMLLRCECEPAFLDSLRAHGEALRERFTPAAELAAWQSLLAGL